jgi:excisionase family DNA binding protein
MTMRTSADELRPVTYSLADVVKITSLSLRKINELVADGRLRSTRIDGRRLIFADSLDELLKTPAA